ncbi:MAG: hypothetical protein ACQESC_03515, partial [Nanobdellota archaeon]
MDNNMDVLEAEEIIQKNEETLFKQLKILKKGFKKLQNRNEEKYRLIETFKQKLHKLDQTTRNNQTTRILKRKTIKKQYKHHQKEIETIINKFTATLQFSIRILEPNISSSEDSKKLLESLQQQNLIKIHDNHEKQFFTKLLEQEHNLIIELLKLTKIVYNVIHFQKDEIKNIKQIPLLEHKQKRRTTQKYITLIIDIFSLIEKNLKKEQSALIKCNELSNRVYEEAKYIRKKASTLVAFDKKEQKRIQKRYNKHDLAEIKDKLGEQYKRHKHKVAFIDHMLKQQRQLRKDIQAEQIIAVHLTNTFPEEGIIKPTSNYKHKLLKEHKIEIEFPRPTIHFALNGPVTSHSYGDFSGRKYAILVPAKTIIDRIINISPQDTFVYGKLKLPPGSEILTPEKGNHNFGNAKLIQVPHTSSIENAVKKRIRERGYTLMEIGTWSWVKPENTGDEMILKRFFEESYMNF